MSIVRLIGLFAVLAALIAPVNAKPAAAQTAVTGTLTMQSQSGDYIGLGRNYSYDTTTGKFSAGVGTSTSGVPNYLSMSYIGRNYDHWWYLDFSTRQLGTPLQVGTYTNARRAPFAPLGHPGLDVSGDGRGCNQLSGSFTIEEIQFEQISGQTYLRRLVATFEQHCEFATPALTGRIEYTDTTDRQAPITTATLEGSAGANGWYVSPVQVSLHADEGTTYYQLDNQPVATYTAPFTVATGGAHTLIYWSVDAAGNQEAYKYRSIKIDDSAPTITATSSLQTVNEKKNLVAQLTVVGNMSDGVSGPDLTSARYSVKDEYGTVQPQGSILVNSDGQYTFSMLLDGPLNNDRDGRRYSLEIVGNDQAGNVGVQLLNVVVTTIR